MRRQQASHSTAWIQGGGTATPCCNLTKEMGTLPPGRLEATAAAPGKSLPIGLSSVVQASGVSKSGSGTPSLEDTTPPTLLVCLVTGDSSHPPHPNSGQQTVVGHLSVPSPAGICEGRASGTQPRCCHVPRWATRDSRAHPTEL